MVNGNSGGRTGRNAFSASAPKIWKKGSNIISNKVGISTVKGEQYNKQ